MQQNRKTTVWKKSRKFGDIHGGRTHLKFADGIFKQQHNLLAPAPGADTPIYIMENPSRDFYFPVNVEEIKNTLKQLPKAHTEAITHIWLDKVKKTDYLKGATVQGAFISGSKVYLIKLYAVPKDNRMLFGQIKPGKKQLSFYKPYCDDLRHNKSGWYLQWTSENYKKYYLEKLLLHEIGHCVDYLYKRHWSKANNKQIEDFTDNYAVIWHNNIKKVVKE